MKPKHLYAALAVIGAVVPLWQFAPFVREHGLAVGLLFEQVFSTPAGAFFGSDVVVSAVVLWLFILTDGRRADVRHLWLPIVATLLVGVSMGLPLFLCMREARLERAVSLQSVA